MRAVMVTGPGTVELVEVPEPTVGPRDVLVAPRACGICGSDLFYVSIGGIPPNQGHTVLGHEAAGVVVQVGPEVTGLSVGDHVVVNPLADPSAIIGNGGPTGALSERLVIRDAQVGRSVRIIPSDVPWPVAALNEPMAVALHAVNRARLEPGGTAAVFGAGPIGLGAALGFKGQGARHVVVVDVVPERLERALLVGADGVINSATENVLERLTELHGAGADALGNRRAGTDVYLDAAGVPAVIDTVLAAAKHRARLSVPAVHKHPVPVDFGAVLATEIEICTSMGYPTEIFEVTDHILANPNAYGQIISHTFDFDHALDAFALAQTPGAAEKVMITF